MSFMQFDNIQISALACAVPSFVQEIDTDSEREDAAYVRSFIKNVGVKRRHISLTGQTGTDLCHGASLKALEKARWTAESIDAVISLTYTPDYLLPGNGHLLHHMLGLRDSSMVFDMNLGCSAFPYGVNLASSLLQTPSISRVLVAFSNTFWPGYKSFEDIKADNAFLFGESGVVMLLEKKSQSPPIKLGLWSDGSGYKFLHHLPGARNPRPIREELLIPNGETVSPGAGIYMDGPAIMSFSTVTVVNSIKESLEYFQKDINSYDGLLLHQANLQIIKTMAKRLKVDMAKVPVSIDRYANTDSASVPLTIVDAYSSNKSESLHLLASSFGIGLSWGVADFHISPSVIAPVFSYDGIFDEGLYKPVKS